MSAGTFVVLFLALLVLYVIAKTAVVVPQQVAYVVERLGSIPTRCRRGFIFSLPSWMKSGIDIP